VPGIDCAFLAMDTEEGVEVVWNEVRISEKKSSKVQLVSNSVCLQLSYNTNTNTNGNERGLQIVQGR